MPTTIVERNEASAPRTIWFRVAQIPSLGHSDRLRRVGRPDFGKGGALTRGDIAAFIVAFAAVGTLFINYQNRKQPPPTTCTPNATQSCGPNALQVCASDGKWSECTVRQHAASSDPNTQAIAAGTRQQVTSSSTGGLSGADPVGGSGVGTPNRVPSAGKGSSDSRRGNDASGSDSSELPPAYAPPANTNRMPNRRGSADSELPPAYAPPANTNKAPS